MKEVFFDMELRQLKYFVEVAHQEHVTRAAEKLHIAQSAISRQISNLELELGVQLFIRQGRNVKLTPIGRMFLRRVENAIFEVEKAEQEIKEYLDTDSGEIRIGFPHSLAAYTLPAVVSAFKLEHPNIQFQLVQGTVTQMIDEMVSGDIDLAFVSPVPTDHPEVEGHVFFREEMLAILPISHPLAEQSSIRLEQLKHDAFIMFRSGFIMRNIVKEACEQAGFEPNIALEGEDSVTIRGLVGAGLGVGILPSVALTGKDSGKTAVVKISEPRVTRTVGFVTPRKRKLAPSEKLFQDFLWDYYYHNAKNETV